MNESKKLNNLHMAAKWIPHDRDCIKINVDAATNIHNDRVGLGLVARNSDGKVVFAASKCQWPFLGAERSEIDAFLWAVQVAKNHGWSRCVVEGDAKFVVEALHGLIRRDPHNQVLVDNILALSSSFQDIRFVFCFREATMVAHKLARRSSSCICDEVWSVGGSDWISDLVLVDSSS